MINFAWKIYANNYITEQPSFVLFSKNKDDKDEIIEIIQKEKIKKITYFLGTLYINLYERQPIGIVLSKIDDDIYSKLITSLFNNYPDKIDARVAKKISKRNYFSRKKRQYEIFILVLWHFSSNFGITFYYRYLV